MKNTGPLKEYIGKSDNPAGQARHEGGNERKGVDERLESKDRCIAAV